MTVINDHKPVLAKSFRALRPIPEKASEVIAPPSSCTDKGIESIGFNPTLITLTIIGTEPVL